MSQEVVVESHDRLYITSTNSSIKNGYLMGFTLWVAGTVTIADDSGTIMPATAVSNVGAYTPLPCRINGTLTVTIAGGAVLTLFYKG